MSREYIEKLAFEKFKENELAIMKSLPYKRYWKIKDLNSMFGKTQPIIAYNTVRIWINAELEINLFIWD